MEILIVGIVAAFASLLTFFSGFGLGTILTPVLILFFPVELAIALSGVVHFLNNIFKVTLTGKQINRRVLLRFGLPAILGAFIGAYVLMQIPDSTILHSYAIGQKTFMITPLKLIIALLMIFFALFEVIPRLKNLQFGNDKLLIGGLLSGFFGGLSGNQGALRSAFLIRTGLTKGEFIATGVMIACLVDFTRLSVYYNRILKADINQNIFLLIVAVLSAFTGAYLGNKLLKKITLNFMQTTITVLIILLSIALGMGLI